MDKHLSKAARDALAATDWRRIDAMTDDDIARQIAANPDAAPDMAPEIDVRDIRRAAGMTQAQFTAAYGFSIRTVQEWERGAKRPSADATAHDQGRLRGATKGLGRRRAMIDCDSNLLAETPLKGGRMTAGVVRVGRTVRRPAKANSDFIRRLLGHLAAKGFDGAPCPLGADESGREVFSYIEGNVPAELGIFDDDALSAAAALIRRFHNLAADLVTKEAETVCHNDLSPCNFVFRDGLPVAIIDFDAAAPGTRARDLGYAAWLWLDFGSPELSPSEQRRRLRLFIGAYGGLEPQAVIGAMMDRQGALAEEGRRKENNAMAEWAGDCLEWTRRHEGDLTDRL